MGDVFQKIPKRSNESIVDNGGHMLTLVKLATASVMPVVPKTRSGAVARQVASLADHDSWVEILPEDHDSMDLDFLWLRVVSPGSTTHPYCRH